jgi:hypothetical protein
MILIRPRLASASAKAASNSSQLAAWAVVPNATGMFSQVHAEISLYCAFGPLMARSTV